MSIMFKNGLYYKLSVLLIRMCLAFLIPSPVYAIETNVGTETGLSLPRFVVLKSNKSNLRNGPGLKYPIKWLYTRKGYPMEVIAEFENWRQIRDIDGTEGWINENLVSGKRNVLIIGNKFSYPTKHYKLQKHEMVLLRYPNEAAHPIVRVEFGVIGNLKKCEQYWCKVTVESYTGWIQKENLWGVYKDETFK